MKTARPARTFIPAGVGQDLGPRQAGWSNEGLPVVEHVKTLPTTGLSSSPAAGPPRSRRRRRDELPRLGAQERPGHALRQLCRQRPDPPRQTLANSGSATTAVDAQELEATRRRPSLGPLGSLSSARTPATTWPMPRLAARRSTAPISSTATGTSTPWARSSRRRRAGTSTTPWRPTWPSHRHAGLQARRPR